MYSLVENADIMKEKLLETINKLREQGVDLGETPALFNWMYEEEPNILIQMLIKEVDESDIPTGETVH